MTTSGAPTPPRFKRSSHRKKQQPRSRRLTVDFAAGEAETARVSVAARPLVPASPAVSAQSPLGRALSREFFEVDALDLAPRLLGKLLRRDEVVLRITEVEAYRPNDSACHGRFGITARTAPVFGPGGHAYVYLCYGLHMMLNVVADKEGVGAAVLIRSCAPVSVLQDWKLFSSVEANKPRNRSYLQDQERWGKPWGFPLTGRIIPYIHLVGWKYWMGRSRRAFWLVPVLALSTPGLSMSQHRGGLPLQALRGSVPQRILSGRGEEPDVWRGVTQSPLLPILEQIGG